MKKVFSVMLVCFMAAALAGCGSNSGSSNSSRGSNSPRGVADKAMKCSKAEDVRGYFDLVYFSEKDQAQKDGFVQMVEEKAKTNTDDSKVIDNYKFVEENVDEENGKATVVYDVTYKNGQTKKENVSLTRDESGKWWVVLDK